MRHVGGDNVASGNGDNVGYSEGDRDRVPRGEPEVQPSWNRGGMFCTGDSLRDREGVPIEPLLLRSGNPLNRVDGEVDPSINPRLEGVESVNGVGSTAELLRDGGGRTSLVPVEMRDSGT